MEKILIGAVVIIGNVLIAVSLIPYGTFWVQDLPNVGANQFFAQEKLSLGDYWVARLQGKRIKTLN